MSKIKYFTKALLVKANKLALDRNYNRALNPEFVAKLTNGLKFPVTFSMLHEHAEGALVDPHVRAVVMYNDKGGTFQLDVDMSLFNALPVAEV